MDPFRQDDLLRRASALAASEQLLPRHFADTIFPSTSIRFSDRMLSNARQYLMSVTSEVEREICAIAVKDLDFPAETFAALGQDSHMSSHGLLERAQLLRDPQLLGHVFSEVQLAELQTRLMQKISQDELEATLTRHIDSDDHAVADAAMAMLVAQGRGMAGSGTSHGLVANMGAETLHALAWPVTAAIARITGMEPQLLAPAAERFLAAHDESDTISSRAQRLAQLLLGGQEPASDLPHPLQDGLHLFIARMAQQTGLSIAQLVQFTAEPDMVRLTVAMRALNWPAQHALSVFAALSSGEELLTAATYGETEPEKCQRIVAGWAAPHKLQVADRALASAQGTEFE